MSALLVTLDCLLTPLNPEIDLTLVLRHTDFVLLTFLVGTTNNAISSKSGCFLNSNCRT